MYEDIVCVIGETLMSEIAGIKDIIYEKSERPTKFTIITDTNKNFLVTVKEI